MVHVVGVGDPEILVKALGPRQHLREMAEVPLSEAGRRIAQAPEMVGDRVLIRMEPDLRRGVEHLPLHAHPLGIAAGQEGRPGGSADRGGDHEVRELPSLAGQPVEVGRADRFGAVAAQVAVAEVVGEDQEHVGRRCLGGGHRQAGGERDPGRYESRGCPHGSTDRGSPGRLHSRTLPVMSDAP